MKTSSKLRIVLLVLILILFTLNWLMPINEETTVSSDSSSAIEPNGGGNPNTVAIFTARVLIVGSEGGMTTGIYRLAIFLFSAIAITGFIFNGYMLYQKQERENRRKLHYQEEELPVEQDYSTSFNND